MPIPQVATYYGAPRGYDPATGPVEIITPEKRPTVAVVVGEQPNRLGQTGWLARSGERLRELGLPLIPWLNLFDRPAERWDRAEATSSALRILEKHGDSSTPLLLLGARVCDAFGLPTDREWLGWYRTWLTRAPLIALPHPSGLNRWWNEPTNAVAASELLRALAGGRLPRWSKGVLEATSS